ncbi:helix-hairpin-helix domain-containing protein [Mucilaginibacter sp. AW1-3]
MKSIKLDLSIAEKARLKKAGVKINRLDDYAIDELGTLLDVSEHRAKALNAHLIFQRLASIGPRFAQDLIDMGYFNLEQLKHKDGAELLNEHERFIGYQTDPCVEDQFRLIVHHANNPGSSRQWWDFTPERKTFRAKFGYPDSRPA